MSGSERSDRIKNRERAWACGFGRAPNIVKNRLISIGSHSHTERLNRAWQDGAGPSSFFKRPHFRGATRGNVGTEVYMDRKINNNSVLWAEHCLQRADKTSMQRFGKMVSSHASRFFLAIGILNHLNLFDQEGKSSMKGKRKVSINLQVIFKIILSVKNAQRGRSISIITYIWPTLRSPNTFRYNKKRSLYLRS